MKINVNNIMLNYDVCGVGNPLILMGGLSANCREWQRVISYLEKSFTVYRPENRGAGETTGWGLDFTIDDMANDMAEFIEKLGLASAYLVGHSMGGAIVQHLCSVHPQCVRAAAIVSSFAHFPKAAQLYIENTAELLKAGVDLELILKTIYTRLYGSLFLSNPILVASEMKRMLTEPMPQTLEGYQAQAQAIGRFDARKKLGDIQCPVLVVNGTEDMLTPTYLSEELNSLIKHSTLKLIPECGHMIPQEKPQELAKLIVDFFLRT